MTYFSLLAQLAFCFVFNIIFLWILWEFQVLYHDHTQLPVFPCPPDFVISPLNKEENKQNQFSLCYLCPH